MSKIKIARKFLGLLAAYAALLVALPGCLPAVAAGGHSSSISVEERRTLGKMIDDRTIAFQAYQLINHDPEISARAHVVTSAYNGTLVLVGQAPSEYLINKAFHLASQVSHVKKIINEITIAEPTSGLTRSSDSWLTAKAKSKMLLAKDLDSTRIKVVTENGIIYLLGLVSPEEAEIATLIASKISGAQKVVKLFEILPQDEIATSQRGYA